MFTSVLKAMNKNIDKNELNINMYDSLTPRWRHYHTPEEIAHSCCCKASGFVANALLASTTNMVLALMLLKKRQTKKPQRRITSE